LSSERTVFLETWNDCVANEVEDSRPIEARCDDERLNVSLADSRVLQTPLWWYPRVLKATPSACADVGLPPTGMHWPAIDENFGVASVLGARRETAEEEQVIE